MLVRFRDGGSLTCFSFFVRSLIPDETSSLGNLLKSSSPTYPEKMFRMRSACFDGWVECRLAPARLGGSSVPPFHPMQYMQGRILTWVAFCSAMKVNRRKDKVGLDYVCTKVSNGFKTFNKPCGIKKKNTGGFQGGYTEINAHTHTNVPE